MRSMVDPRTLALALLVGLAPAALIGCSTDGDDAGGAAADTAPTDTTGEDSATDEDTAAVDTSGEDADEDVEPGDTAGEDTADAALPDTAGIDAEALYTTYCAFCHGDNGQGYVSDNANALAHPEFLRIADDDFVRTAIIEGRPGTPMSPWGAERGGPLDAAEVEAITQYIRAWADAEPLDLDDVVVDGSALRGQGPYAVHCAACHGDEGQGVSAISLNNPWFLATASDGFIQHTIVNGRPGTPMPSYQGTLSDQAIADITALIRSWQTPTDGSTIEPFEQDLTRAPLHPDGAPADFTLREDRFVPGEQVHAAMEAGENFVLVDARPTADYLGGHIEGAVSVPFYDVERAITDLPRDLWIVTYCGCPHAVSGQARDALAEAGFERVAVLDEGFYWWQDQGYPVREGETP